MLILRPPVPRWWHLCFLIFWTAQFCGFCVISVFFIRLVRSFPSAFGGLPLDLKLVLIGQFVVLACWMLVCVRFGLWSFRQYQIGLIPRKLWISDNSIHLNHAGNWRISTLTRDLQTIREIRLKPIKGFIGDTAGALLIIRFGRFRRWSFRFKQNQMPVAIEACRQFGQRLDSREKSNEAIADVEMSKGKAEQHQ